MVESCRGWMGSEKLGYDGLIEIVNRLMLKGRSNLETEQSAVISFLFIIYLKNNFIIYILVLFKMLVAPIGGGRLASMMVARVTAWSCQWLMGASSVNSIDLPDGSSCSSGVFVERCKYLEESKCIGICINTCKLPTQTFFKDYMGIPLYMEPKFSDYSCQFNFGVPQPPRSSDSALHEPCLEICPNANRRKELNKGLAVQCPKV
ncbi:Beta-carotene isomerase D27, chloroplastic [Dendrobium catenatum]|uniref:Beta-carotene isomerase D27, chloroplastic n=1 Tax=Dendrobium catenatum TaxID=906689 RepID=A0A2I0WSD7_9ASPA|nr:Beta-carotene isomerase D27, chloroplastic [Dendrobium catenatum]